MYGASYFSTKEHIDHVQCGLSRLLMLAASVLFSSLFLIVLALPAYAAEPSEIAGANRYATAAKQAETAYPNGSKTAIIVSSESWSDSLAAISLAGAIDSPILFCEAEALPVATSETLKRFGTDHVIIVGNEDAVFPSIEGLLASLDAEMQITRISGSTKYETQMAVYEYGRVGFDGVDHWNHELAIITTGSNFSDGLSVSPLIVAEAAPIFLANDKGLLSEDQERALLAGGYSRALIVGGTASVAEETEGYLEAVTMAEAGNSGVVRLGGGNRYETSAMVASWCVEEGYLSWDGLAFASGITPYDALAGSVLQGKKRSVLLLADDATSTTISSAAKNASSISEYVYFGGTGVIARPLRTYIDYSFTMGSALPMGKARIWDRSYVHCDKSGVVSEDRITYSGYIAKANKYSSTTLWMILVDVNSCKTIVFSGGKDNWVVEQVYTCTPGAWSTPTKKGVFTVGLKGTSFGSGYTCWYWTQFSGNYLFHSVLYEPGSKTKIQDGRLGIHASHGCVRLDINDAKWIYDNIPTRSRVVVY